MEVDDLRRNLIASRILVRLFRAPSLKGERAKYVSSIVMSCLCRLELTTRRRCEEESEFQGLLSNMLVSVLSRTNTFRLHAHHISVCLQKMIYLSSTLKEDITSALIALVQHRPRQLCCCLAVYVLISRFWSRILYTYDRTHHRYTSLLQHVLSVVFEEQETRLKEQELTRYIRHLQRICELVVQKPVRDAFRHHVVYLLSHYLKLAVRRKDPLALNHEKSMMSVVASMFDVCSKHELQQLHILLDPPRRALMKTLHNKYLAEYKYSGNVWGFLLYFLKLLRFSKWFKHHAINTTTTN